ncbi:unnamed protein product, partial [Discosporangium mesarthrocarpum]
LLRLVGEKNTEGLGDLEDLEEIEESNTSNRDQPQKSSTGETNTRATPGEELRRSPRLAHKARVDCSNRLRLRATDDLSNLVKALANSDDDDAFCFLGMTGEVATAAGEPSSTVETLASK